MPFGRTKSRAPKSRPMRSRKAKAKKNVVRGANIVGKITQNFPNARINRHIGFPPCYMQGYDMSPQEKLILYYPGAYINGD